MTEPPPVACARCAALNHPAVLVCAECGLPLGRPEADPHAALDVFGSYEPPDPTEPNPSARVQELVVRCGFDSAPFGPGWRVLVPLRDGRRQAVYMGPTGPDADGRTLIGLISVCSPASERSAFELLRLNSKVVEGHYAILVLRGEPYFVITHTMPLNSAAACDAANLVRRLAEQADRTEDQLSRGGDLY